MALDEIELGRTLERYEQRLRELETGHAELRGALTGEAWWSEQSQALRAEVLDAIGAHTHEHTHDDPPADDPPGDDPPADDPPADVPPGDIPPAPPADDPDPKE